MLGRVGLIYNAENYISTLHSYSSEANWFWAPLAVKISRETHPLYGSPQGEQTFPGQGLPLTCKVPLKERVTPQPCTHNTISSTHTHTSSWVGSSCGAHSVCMQFSNKFTPLGRSCPVGKSKQSWLCYNAKKKASLPPGGQSQGKQLGKQSLAWYQLPHVYSFGGTVHRTWIKF